MNVELLVAGLAALRRAVEPEERLSRIGLAGEQLLERGLPAGTPASEALQGAVAIEHDALLVDDLKPVVEAVGDVLDHLGFDYALAQAQVARQQTEDEKCAGHRQQHQQPEHGHLARTADQQRDEGEAADGDKADKQQKGASRLLRPPPAKPSRGRRQIVACLHVYHGGQS